MPYDSRPWRERFYANLPTPVPSGCWEWQGDRGTHGYGRICVDGKREGAHRVSFRLHHGAIPPGMHVCHSCDNPPCVNPGHLFLGTAKDNAQDRQNKGRHTPPVFRRDQHPRAKLSEAQADDIRSRLVKGRGGNTTALADEFGVTPRTIRNVASNKGERQ